jgi:hypothetical protein
MKEHRVDQLSPEWFALRVGKITGSLFPDLMPKDNAKVEYTQGQYSLLVQIASEILTGEAEETFTSKAMQWGVDMEESGREALSDYLMTPIRESGFWEYSEWAGASPDGIGGNMDFVAEIKCPTSKTHMLYLLDSEKLWKKYRWQVVAESLCSGIDNAYICSYDPRFPLDKSIVVHDPGDLSADREKLAARIESAVEIIKGMIK